MPGETGRSARTPRLARPDRSPVVYPRQRTVTPASPTVSDAGPAPAPVDAGPARGTAVGGGGVDGGHTGRGARCRGRGRQVVPQPADQTPGHQRGHSRRPARRVRQNRGAASSRGRERPVLPADRPARVAVRRDRGPDHRRAAAGAAAGHLEPVLTALRPDAAEDLSRPDLRDRRRDGAAVRSHPERRRLDHARGPAGLGDRVRCRTSRRHAVRRLEGCRDSWRPPGPIPPPLVRHVDPTALPTRGRRTRTRAERRHRSARRRTRRRGWTRPW